MISGVDETQPSVGKEYVISDQPYSFIPFSGNPRARLEGAGSVAGPFYLRFGPAEARMMWGRPVESLDVSLTPGNTYYINFREWRNPGDDTQRGAVSSEFVVYPRTD